MEEFWIQLLAILTLLTQTCSASDTPELIRAVGGSVTFRSPSTDGDGALWSFGNDPILTVAFGDPPQPIFSEDKFKTRFTVSERGRALSISQLRMKDAGTYSVNIDGKISTFILRVYRELTEPTVTCDTHECSGSIWSFSLHCSVTGTGFGDISYTWRKGLQLWDEGSVVVTVDKSSLDNREPLICTARNAVSSRSVIVTISGVQCSGPSMNTWVWIMVAGAGFLMGNLMLCICQVCCSATLACSTCVASC